jgi:hypothetical protein
LKRSATDVLRRGFDNMVANWPLVAIRVAEGVLCAGLAIASVFALLVPLLVSAGLSHFDPNQFNINHLDPDRLGETLLAFLADHWVWILYLVLGITALLTLFIAIHSAVEAGSAQVYLDAEHAAAISRMTTRDRFSAFSMERWVEGVKRGWWATFWIYNIAWGVAGLIILLPLTLASLVIVFTGTGVGAIVIGCLALLVTVLLAFAVSVVTNLWAQKAIVIAVARTLGARRALRESWAEATGDFARQFGVALLLLLIGIAGATMIASMSAGLSIGGQSLAWQLMVSPVRVVASLLNTVFSAAMAAWFLACFTSITLER